ncbi:MAG TPA: alpha/beta family hydrolase [Actinoplanes sp.]|nr:alpha/beta family hydrolase [Actinoplanes sp.]
MSTWTTTHQVPAAGVVLDGDLSLPDSTAGVVLFAHGSGSSRHSPRNRAVAGALNRRGMATLLVDLLTADEERIDARTGQLRFDIGLLADRLVGIIDWLGARPETAALPVGLFGASTGAAAALVAAAKRPETVRAVVSRGGRPDLAGPALAEVNAPTLLIVGARDVTVLELNERASNAMRAPVELRIIPGATHLFEEPGTLEQVAELAAEWFGMHLTPAA